MKPSEPPAEPIVATITISVVVIFVREMKKIAKKNSAAIVGPSSMTPNDSVRYEFMAHSTTDSTSPAIRLRLVSGGTDIRAAYGKPWKRSYLGQRGCAGSGRIMTMRILLAILLVSSVAHADDGVTASTTVAQPPHQLVYAEVLGKGGLYGIGYEHVLAPWLALGGAGSWSALRGQHVTTLAPYAHATIVSRGHHALFGELGAIFARSSIATPVPDWDGMVTYGAAGFASVGYEHTSRRIVLRASPGLVVGRGGAQPMIGLAIGVRP
jgi:hypothetical protein